MASAAQILPIQPPHTARTLEELPHPVYATYLPLILKPLRTEADYTAVMGAIEALWGSAIDTAEGQVFELLATLAYDYEQRTVPPIGPPSLKFAIAEALKAQGLKQKDLVPAFGDKTAVSRLVNGKRRPTLEQARLLHHRLGIDPDTILADLKAHIIRAED